MLINLTTLVLLVMSAPYNTSDYQLNVFDCTNMAALLHDHLESNRFDVKVVIGLNGNIPKYNHAWLMVGEIDYIKKTHDNTEVKLVNGSYWIEPITKTVIGGSLPQWYKFRVIRVFDNYTDVYFWSQNEFDY